MQNVCEDNLSKNVFSNNETRYLYYHPYLDNACLKALGGRFLILVRPAFLLI